jgi:hypothetical protein
MFGGWRASPLQHRRRVVTVLSLTVTIVRIVGGINMRIIRHTCKTVGDATGHGTTADLVNRVLQIKPNNPSTEAETAETGLPRTEIEQKENRNSRNKNKNRAETSDVSVSFLVEQKHNRNRS